MEKRNLHIMAFILVNSETEYVKEMEFVNTRTVGYTMANGEMVSMKDREV